MAQINISKYYYAVNFELSFTTLSQNVANNTSQVRVLGRIYGQGNNEKWTGTTTGKVVFNGSEYSFSMAPYNWPNATAINITVFDRTFTVAHGSDGKKTVTGSMIWNHGVTWFNTASVSETVALATIPRASQPTLNVSTQAIESAITISTNRASTSFTHTLTYSFGNQSGTIATGVTTSQLWRLPVGLASAIPNATSGVGTITCQTYNGTTLIGSKSVPFTATVPNNSTFQPTATISSIVQGTTLPSGITVYVQNKSKAKVTSTGTGKYSATIKTYSVSVANIGTYTGSVITSDFLKNSGTVRVTLTVTDSRGLKGSTYQDINVVAYSPPRISTFNASRSESTPTNILISYNASVSSVSNQNGVVYRIRSLASGGSWVVNRNVTTGYTSAESFSITSDPDKSYTIEIYVADKWTSVTRTIQVGTAFTLIDFNESGKGMAIGKVSESDELEVDMPTKFSKTVKADGDIRDKNGANVLGFTRISNTMNTLIPTTNDHTQAMIVDLATTYPIGNSTVVGILVGTHSDSRNDHFVFRRGWSASAGWFSFEDGGTTRPRFAILHYGGNPLKMGFYNANKNIYLKGIYVLGEAL